MKLIIVLSAVILAVSAFPTDVGQRFTKICPPIEAHPERWQNGTARDVPEELVGFATVNGGTYGGAGGSVWTVWDPWALRDALAGNEPRIVYVRGRIDLTLLFEGPPGVLVPVGSYKTIIGGDSDAMIFGGGLELLTVTQIIIKKLKMFNALTYGPGEQPDGNGGIVSIIPGDHSQIDSLDITMSTHIWIDHCEFADDPWVWSTLPENMRRHDGTIDCTCGTNLVTVSNCLFRNHNHNMLTGHADYNGEIDFGRLKITYVLNWFQGVNQRNPRVRFGEVHVLNNLYTDIGSYGIGAGAGAKVYGEKNVFINTRRSWRFPAGVPEPMGHFFNDNNLLLNSQHDDVPGDVDWRPSNYYQYSPMDVNNVEDHVRRFAGV